MLPVLPDTVQPLELIWTAIATVGAGFAAYNLIQSVQDYFWTRRMGIFNGRRVAAKGTAAIESARFLIQVIFITIGVIAMTYPRTPPPQHEETKQFIYRIVFTYGFVLASLLLMSNTVVTAWIRRKLTLGKPSGQSRRTDVH